MAKLVYATIMSLDGYIADENGTIDWAAPDPEVFRFINDLERGLGTYLYGRKLYETMVYWETFEASGESSAEEEDFARTWRAAEKVVYSRTLRQGSSARTRIEPVFDPGAVRQMKETADEDISVGGPELAGQAMASGLIDEIHLFVTPVVLGRGTAALTGPWPSSLELSAVDRFGGGVVHLQYRTVS
jgi:dihydrofolate reductase